jgi:hypothetical protein
LNIFKREILWIYKYLCLFIRSETWSYEIAMEFTKNLIYPTIQPNFNSIYIAYNECGERIFNIQYINKDKDAFCFKCASDSKEDLTPLIFLEKEEIQEVIEYLEQYLLSFGK